MPRLFSSRRIIKVLEQQGFIFISQKGSHAKYRRGSLTVIVPMHGKEVPYGTFRSILRQAHLKEDHFSNS